MTILYEIQASHVGIGKSTFVQKIPYPFSDDCIDLVDSLGDYFYNGNRFFLSNNADIESLFKAFMVLEHSACSISNTLKHFQSNIIVASRSALVSAVQFLNFEPTRKQIESLVDFYQSRLSHIGIEKVVVLDFGSSISSDRRHVRMGFDNMRERGRSYELNYFSSFEKYQRFFDWAENKKEFVLPELIKRAKFFKYFEMDFYGFGNEDYFNVLRIIKMDGDHCWNVRDLGIFNRVIKPLLLAHAKNEEFPIWQTALDQHRKNNRHHPEYFEKLTDMEKLDKEEALSDILSCPLTNQRKRGITDWKIPEAANICKNWSTWNIVKDLYKGEYRESSNLLPRWPLNKFLHEKEWLILWVQMLFSGQINEPKFIEGLYGFDSIHHYVQDLMWHQFLVSEVANELFPKNQPLHVRCSVHDYDKCDAFMVAAYTLKWIFQVDTVPIQMVGRDNAHILTHIMKRAIEQESKLLRPPACHRN